MRAALLICCLWMLLPLLPCRAAEDSVDLTVTWVEFSTKDPALAKAVDGLLREQRNAAPAEAVALLHRRAGIAQEESLAAFVRLGKKFELSKVEELRTYRIAGTLKPAGGNKLLVEVQPQYREELPDRGVAGRPGVSERSSDIGVELALGDEFTLCSSVATRMDARGTEYRILAIIVGVNKIERPK
jgi:hypothetical protein